jgi:hypothetical protein
MSYKRETDIVLAGSLNLLPPGDLIPDEDAIALQGWRVDQAGALRSRLGQAVLRAADAGTNYVHTLFLDLMGPHRFVGAGVNLYRDDVTPAAYATGFDGTALGMASMWGCVYVMNRAKAGRDRAGTGAGAGWQAWGMPPPPAPSLAGSAASAGVPAPAVRPYFVSTGDGIDGDTTPVGGTLPLGPVYYCMTYVDAAGNESPPGPQIALNTYQQTVDGVTTAYQEEQLWAQPNDAGGQAWTSGLAWGLGVLVTYTPSGGVAAVYQSLQAANLGNQPDTSPTWWLKTNTPTGWNLYRAVTTGGVTAFARLNTSGPMPFSPATARVFVTDTGQAGGATLPTGSLAAGVAYEYFVTQVNLWGEESNPAGPVAYTGQIGEACQITVAQPTDTTIVSWNVYRIGNTLENAYRVNQDPILYPPATGGALTFIDDGADADLMSDVEVTRLGIALQTDNDPPPLCAGLAGPYYDELLAFNSAANPNWLFWSKPTLPYAWPGAALDEGNHTPVGDDGEAIVQITLHPQHARIYKVRSIWRCVGDPDSESSTLEMTNAEIGLTGPKAICSYGDLDYFEGPEGIYSHSGYGTPKKISGKLDPLFKGDAVTLPGAAPSTPLNLTAAVRALNTMAVRNGRLYFSYAAGAATSPNATLVCDLDAMRWYSDDRGFTALYDEGQGNGLTGAAAGIAYTLEAPQTGSIALLYQTGYRDQGERGRQKTYDDIAIEYSVNAGAASDQSLAVSVSFDSGATSMSLGPLFYQTAAAGAARNRALFGLAPATAPAAWGGAVNYALAAVALYGTACYESLQAANLCHEPDTSPLWWAPVSAPGGGLDTGHAARNISIAISGAAVSPVTIFSIESHYFLLARDACAFNSDDTHLDYQGVKQMDLIEFDVDAPGAWLWSLYSDRPGGAMACRAGAIAAATSGRQSIQIPFAMAEGRLARVTVHSAAAFRLYGLRVRLRKLGTYIDGAAGESFSTLAQRGA